jgi:hypothetical protein
MGLPPSWVIPQRDFPGSGEAARHGGRTVRPWACDNLALLLKQQ